MIVYSIQKCIYLHTKRIKYTNLFFSIKISNPSPQIFTALILFDRTFTNWHCFSKKITCMINKTNESFNIKSVTFRNRVGMPPMCQYSAIDGFANDWHLVHYGARAVGAVGLIIVEATAVVPEGRITPYDLGIWSNEHVEGLRKIASFIHNQDSVAGIQIAHAGRKASHDKPALGGKQLSPETGGWQTVAPSAIPFDDSEIPPTELTVEQIEELIVYFTQAAIRAKDAGFKVLEIHAAHGYLIHEFLSPLTNIRKDEYGGSFENRIRLLLQITDAVREIWPSELALFVRLSVTEWADGGWNEDESFQLAKMLKAKGVDLIDCSTGGNINHVQIPVEPLYQVRFSEKIKTSGIMTSAVGLITDTEQIEDILKSNKADLVLVGRELLRNPYFMLGSNEVAWPEQYLRAK